MSTGSPRRQKSRTKFGRALEELRSKFGFNLRELIEQGVSEAETQTLSRMSHSAGFITAMSVEKRNKLVSDLSGSIVTMLRDRLKDDVDVSDQLAERIEVRLLEALKKDLRDEQLRPLALDIAGQLSQITSRSIQQLALDLEDETLRSELKRLWYWKDR